MIGRRSMQSPKSVTHFNSYRKQGKAGSPPATTSNLYDVLKRVDWLVLFSPWYLINKSKRYTTLLLPTIFVSVFICFSGAAKAKSRPEVGAAEAVKPLQIGDTIPEELWNMRLQVVNHPDGKDTITLNDYRDKKLIILDFWATWCAPCVRSMYKWEDIQRVFPHDLFFLGVHIDSEFKAYPYIQEKKWSSPSIISSSAYFLNNLFFDREVVSRVIWIYGDRVLAITGLDGYGIEEVKGLLNGVDVVLQNNYNWTYGRGAI